MRQNSIERKIHRLMATGDIKRLVRLREKLQKQQAARHTRAEFRRSYKFEDWVEQLLTELKN